MLLKSLNLSWFNRCVWQKQKRLKRKNKQEEREINRTERDKKAPNTNCNSSQISVRKSLYRHLMFRAWGWKGKPTWKICGVSLLLFFSFSSSSKCDTDSSKPLFTWDLAKSSYSWTCKIQWLYWQSSWLKGRKLATRSCFKILDNAQSRSKKLDDDRRFS